MKCFAFRKRYTPQHDKFSTCTGCVQSHLASAQIRDFCARTCNRRDARTRNTSPSGKKVREGDANTTERFLQGVLKIFCFDCIITYISFKKRLGFWRYFFFFFSPHKSVRTNLARPLRGTVARTHRSPKVLGAHDRFVSPSVHRRCCVCVPFGFTEGEPSTCAPKVRKGARFVSRPLRGTVVFASPSGSPKVSQVRAPPKVREGLYLLRQVRASPSLTFFPEGDVLRVRASLRLHVRAQKSPICAEEVRIV